MKIIIDRMISPKGFDLVFSSTDSLGTPGQLNSYILSELGGGSLPKSEFLKDGFSNIPAKSGSIICYIVTITDEDKRAGLLMNNLSKAFKARPNRLANRRVWMPLLATGMAGLSLKESFDQILTALSNLREEEWPIELFISVPKETIALDLVYFREKASELLEVVRVMDAVDEHSNISWKIDLKNHLESQNINFYAVGSYWGGEDQWARFIVEGIWEVGDDESIEIVNQIKPGDFLILKSTYHANGAGYFRIKYIGVVIENKKDGFTINHVNWSYAANNVDVTGSLARLRHRITKIDVDDFIEIVEAIDDLDGLSETGLFERKYFGKDDFTPKLPKHTRSEAISTDHGSKDSLGFTKDVQSLAALIALKEMKPPLAIALFGNWGSGKSFFMENLEMRIRELSKFQGFLERRGEVHVQTDNDVFLSGIAHIKFNAWSYMDANLWAGLASSLFEKLDQYIKDNTKGEKECLRVQEKINERLQYLNKDLNEHVDISFELKKRKADLELQREHKLLEWFTPKYDDKMRAFLVHNGMDENEIDNYLPSKLRKHLKNSFNLLSYLKGNSYQVTIWVLAIVVMFWLFANLAGPHIPFLASFFASIWTKISLTAIAPLVVFGRFIFKYRKYITSLLILSNQEDNLKEGKSNQYEQQEIITKIRENNATILALETKIQQANASKENLNQHAIENLISEIPIREDYVKHLGIITTIRKDFETLSDLFTVKDEAPNETLNEKERERITELNTVREEIRDAFTENRRLNRIVLYIDDLDRCTDEKVLEVLQAVHLLMAFPLFTVVVGVDERSVHNALKFSQLKRYQGIDKELVSKSIEEIEPREYLEKIFQLPFQLPEATSEGVEQLINDIIPNPAYESFDDTGNADFADPEAIEKEMRERPYKVIENDKGALIREAPSEYRTLSKTIKPEEIRITVKEKEYLQLFAPLVGNNPRTLKRYVNIFRIVKTHELDIFRDKDSLFKIAFLIALYSGKHQRIASAFLRNQSPFTLREFLKLYDHQDPSKADFEEMKLLRLIESLQRSETIDVDCDVLEISRAEQLELFKFIERFSYKLDS
jgi:hypothetical protein